jgi:hypothetical protein
LLAERSRFVSAGAASAKFQTAWPFLSPHGGMFLSRAATVRRSISNSIASADIDQVLGVIDIRIPA